jgi:hypothetical protein
VTAQAPPAADPLAMARNLVARVQGYAQALEDAEGDPDARLRLQINQIGDRAHQGAQLAGHLALVSIAEDMHAIRLVLCQADDQLRRQDAEGEQL